MHPIKAVGKKIVTIAKGGLTIAVRTVVMTEVNLLLRTGSGFGAQQEEKND